MTAKTKKTQRRNKKESHPLYLFHDEKYRSLELRDAYIEYWNGKLCIERI